ncbi:MAG: type IX secretion system membrane protein PorP/SprF [Bacteroidota bacterium]
MKTYIPSYIRIALLLAFVWPMAASAQQVPMYSQYMFNGLVLNPAYAGSKGYISSTLIVREQWTGIDEAPSTQSFSFHGPSRNLRHGFGFTFVNDKAGAINDMNLAVDYAYRIPVGKTGALSFGLEAGVNNYRANYDGLRTETDATDIAIVANNVNLWLPDVNFGIYYDSRRFYIGASARHLVPNNLHDTGAGDFESIRERHYLATAGVVIDLGRDVKFKPSTLVKYHPAAPLQADLNASFLFREKLWTGVSWRSFDAVAFILEWQATKAFRLGYSYDLSTSRLQGISGGSHEFMLGFDLHFRGRGNVSPRFF